MNIKAHGEVSAIRFKHESLQMNMGHILPVVYMEGAPIEPNTIAYFEFKDIREIEMMILMLEKFKEICNGKIGSWGRVV